MQAPDMTEDVAAAPAHTAPVIEHAHPQPSEYVKVAVVLAAITGAEVGVYYLDLVKGLMIGILLILAITKFAMVVLWFMHLKFDSRLFSWFFVGGLTVALIAFMVVLSTFRVFVS